MRELSKLLKQTCYCFVKHFGMSPIYTILVQLGEMGSSIDWVKGLKEKIVT